VLLGSSGPDQEAVPRSQEQSKKKEPQTPRTLPVPSICLPSLFPCCMYTQCRKRTERRRIMKEGPGGNKKAGMSALYFISALAGAGLSSFGRNFYMEKEKQESEKGSG